MPTLSKEEKEALHPIISPFERSDKVEESRVLKEGETHKDEFQDYIHDAIDDHRPVSNYIELTVEEVEIYIKVKGRYQEKCFLWVIDDTSIKMIREKTRNVLRTLAPEYVCHTNLTGGGKAFVGGELFFGEDGSIYINPFSDRYGKPSPQQWQTALNYFRRVGYENIVDILELLSQ
jgi:hypothetical protein